MFEHGLVGIRAITGADLEWMANLRSNPHVWQYLSVPALISPEEQSLWYQALARDSSREYYVLYSARNPLSRLGYVRFDEIDRINRTMRVGGDISPDYQGLGFGQAMLRLIKKYAFDYLEFERLWLLVLETNAIGLHVYQKAGFKQEGVQRQAIYRNGRRLDYIQMSYLKDEYEQSNNRS